MMKFIGEVAPHGEYECTKCGSPLWGDNGYVTQNGVVCVNRMRCDMRVSRAELNKMQENGIKPRWRA